MNIVKYVASVITDDPDVLLELDASMNPPMSSAENVVDTTPTPLDAEKMLQKTTDERDLITNRNRNTRQLDQQQQQERTKLLNPQMRQLHKSLDKMQTGMTQNEKDTTDVRDQTTKLDQELNNVTKMLQQFEKNIL